MSYTTSMNAAPAQSLMGKMRTFIEMRRRHVADQRAIRQTFAELSAMNDRELADIGVARGDIRHIASQAVANI